MKPFSLFLLVAAVSLWVALDALPVPATSFSGGRHMSMSHGRKPLGWSRDSLILSLELGGQLERRHCKTQRGHNCLLLVSIDSDSRSVMHCF